VRLLALSVALGACSFQPHAAGSDAPPVPADVSPPTEDAPADAAMVTIDAPPDACSDDDGDGDCNEDDDWACGAQPAAPGAMLMFNHGPDTRVTISQIAVEGGQLVSATPGEMLSVTFRYDIDDTACPGNCIDQLELGYTNRVKCVFDAAVSHGSGAHGVVSSMIAAPGQPGQYDLHVAIGQNFSCNSNGAHDWYFGPPDPSQTLATLCVH
jgi:hypothetical protein